MIDQPQVSIRAATATDQAVIYTLVLQNNLNPFDLHWSSFRVAVSENHEVVGCGQIKQHGSLQELASLVVAKKWQGRGISHLLMDDLLEQAGRPLWLMCESPLISYYQKLGFGEVKGFDALPGYFQGISMVTRLSMNVVFFLRGTYLAFMVMRTLRPAKRID